MNTQVFYIVSCARSGSTSLTRILSAATNARCESEPPPDVNRECRDAMDGRLRESHQSIVERVFAPRVEKTRGTVAVYGEKHVTLAPFMYEMHRQLGCKFVYIQRDGRDVVRSLLDWHNLKFGTIYREAADCDGLTANAKSNSSNLLSHHDTSDYSRPRPAPNDPLYRSWESFTRFEMCAYYWSRINEYYLEKFVDLPAEAWITIDYKKPTAQDVLRVAKFIGLEGLSEERVASMLDEKINSVAYRQKQDAASGPDLVSTAFPKWEKWTPDLMSKFDRLAARTMQRLGYYPKAG